MRFVVSNFCCFVDFRKTFDIIPRTNLWKMMEEIMVLLHLRVVLSRLYENIISKIKATKDWSKEINYNIVMKQGCPTHFGLYIDRLKE